ncbi:hypothetical protein [Ancylomarina sp. 16SWW S1-10-2]|uniref:hypothetical protein n=1 Tax=Ancylomarina sp. 16SWW S1-10-2 TaxID=2499681 RepID=UPI0012ADFAEB|nr:hypothetical protein [Ancylomarina sp. 16SWW S1-10-2]MRT94870.1 hypothetical protein [Ancylomarina sp. 16SWW S1-10-2]
MRNKLAILGLLIVYVCNGQEVKEIEVKYSNSSQVKERFYVLKSDESIKYGDYKSYHRIHTDSTINDSIRIKEAGSYFYNSRHGLWIS